MTEVRAYSVNALKSLMEDASEASSAWVDSKFHNLYFERYFEEIGAKTIVVEHDYTDRDYLEDYAAYYVRCFHPYKRVCTRLHFFGSQFDGEQFSALLGGQGSALAPEILRDSYLGFIVVKPLPQTFIGRTCLRSYNTDGGRRHYPIKRNYAVSLYGLSLNVESLAFQEQDTVAGACATSALWSIFQGTGVTFQHHIPSPVEVSNYADRMSGSESRRSPSPGLNDEQAEAAIKAVGLEPRSFKASDRWYFSALTYAYLKGKVPIYLGIALCPSPPTDQEWTSRQLQAQGLHAVATLGFSKGDLDLRPNGQSQFRLEASRMDRIYVHDDQVGPFARMGLLDLTATDGDVFALDTSWGEEPRGQSMIAIPDVMIVPLYHKIRVPFDTVLQAVYDFDAGLKAFLASVPDFPSDRIHWDIHLTSTSEIKGEILSKEGLSPDRRREILTKPLPRFLWRAEMLFQGETQGIILMDATDLEQGDLVVDVIQSGWLCGAWRLAAALPEIQNHRLKPQWKIWKWLIEHPEQIDAQGV